MCVRLSCSLLVSFLFCVAAGNSESTRRMKSEEDEPWGTGGVKVESLSSVRREGGCCGSRVSIAV